MLLFLFAHCIVSICSLFVFIFDDYETKVFFSRLRYLGFSLFGSCTLLFINSIYKHWRWPETKWGLFTLFTPPLITWIITLTPSLQDLMVTNFQIFESYNLKVLSFETGPWFSIHIFTSYTYSIIAMILAICVYKTKTHLERQQIFIIWLGCNISSFIDIYCITTGSPLRWLMLSGATFLFADLAVLYASFRYQLFEIVPYAIERVFNSLSDPILVVNQAGNLEIANHSAIDHLKIDKKFYGKNLNSTSDFKLLKDADINVNNKHFNVIHKPIINSRGLAIGTIIFLRDISSRKLIESHLNSHLDFKSKILSLIAHDALGNIKAQTAIVHSLKKATNFESQDLLSLIAESNVTIHDFMQNILNWEKSQIDNFISLKKPFDLNLFIKTCISTVDISAKLKAVEIVVEQNTKHQTIVYGDSEMLAVVIRNLLSNAIRASQNSQKVIVRISKLESNLEIEIQDYGIGISSAMVEKIMSDSTERLTENTKFNGGFGIGLQLVRYFVKLQNGSFKIKSQENLGTTFYLSVPI